MALTWREPFLPGWCRIFWLMFQWGRGRLHRHGSGNPSPGKRTAHTRQFKLLGALTPTLYQFVLLNTIIFRFSIINQSVICPNALQVSSTTSSVHHNILIVHYTDVRISELQSLPETKTILCCLSSTGGSTSDEPLICADPPVPRGRP